MTDSPSPELEPIHPDDDDGAPLKAHGDPLLAASQGAQEGTEGSRHGVLPEDTDQG